MATDWGKLTVVDLRTELKKRGLPLGGKKVELVSRLVEADESDDPEDATANEDQAVADDQPATAESRPPRNEDQLHVPAPPTRAMEDVHTAPDSASTPRDPKVADAPPAEPTAVSDTSTVTEKPADVAEQPKTAAPESEVLEKDEKASDVSVLAPSEIIRDVQRRKRRSRSPEVQSLDVARKRARVSDNWDKGSESGAIAEKLSDETSGPKADSLESATVLGDGTTAAVSHAKIINTQDSMDIESAVTATTEDKGPKEEVGSRRDEDDTMRNAQVTVTEHTGLRQNDGGPAAYENGPDHSRDIGNDGERLGRDRRGRSEAGEPAVYSAVEDGAGISPSLHPATSALYIKNFMRPLKESVLRDYLVELATPPAADLNPDIVVEFHVDQIRTHAFVQFASTAAASRARIALHGKVWPDERNRKELWVDFIPSEKVVPWIEQEADAGRGRGTMKRWEVIYQSDEEGVMTAALVEAEPDSVRPPQPPTQAAAPMAPKISTAPAPSFPGIEAAPRGPRGGNSSLHRDAAGEMTSATRARPSLLYKPAPQEVVERRLADMRSYYTKDRHRDMGRDDEINRYTFENVTTFVDRGKEVFVGIRPPHREKERQEGRRGPPAWPPAGDRYYGTGGNRETPRAEAGREVNRSRFTGEPLPTFHDYRPDHRGGGLRRSQFRSDRY